MYWNAFEDAKGKLPLGWERRFNPAGKVYHVDHNTQHNTWIRPMPLPLSKSSEDPRSYFDGLHRGSDDSANSAPSPASSPLSRAGTQPPPLPIRRKPVISLSQEPQRNISAGKSEDTIRPNLPAVADVAAEKVPVLLGLAQLRTTSMLDLAMPEIPTKSFHAILTII